VHTVTKVAELGSLGNKQELLERVSAAVLAGKGLVLGREEEQAEGQAVLSAPASLGGANTTPQNWDLGLHQSDPGLSSSLTWAKDSRHHTLIKARLLEQLSLAGSSRGLSSPDSCWGESSHIPRSAPTAHLGLVRLLQSKHLSTWESYICYISDVRCSFIWMRIFRSQIQTAQSTFWHLSESSCKLCDLQLHVNYHR